MRFKCEDCKAILDDNQVREYALAGIRCLYCGGECEELTDEEDLDGFQLYGEDDATY